MATTETTTKASDLIEKIYAVTIDGEPGKPVRLMRTDGTWTSQVRRHAIRHTPGVQPAIAAAIEIDCALRTNFTDAVKAAKAMAKVIGMKGKVGGWIYCAFGSDQPFAQGWYATADRMLETGYIHKENPTSDTLVFKINPEHPHLITALEQLERSARTFEIDGFADAAAVSLEDATGIRYNVIDRCAVSEIERDETQPRRKTCGCADDEECDGTQFDCEPPDDALQRLVDHLAYGGDEPNDEIREQVLESVMANDYEALAQGIHGADLSTLARLFTAARAEWIAERLPEIPDDDPPKPPLGSRSDLITALDAAERRIEQMTATMQRLFDYCDDYADGAEDSSDHARLCCMVSDALYPFVETSITRRKTPPDPELLVLRDLERYVRSPVLHQYISMSDPKSTTPLQKPVLAGVAAELVTLLDKIYGVRGYDGSVRGADGLPARRIRSAS